MLTTLVTVGRNKIDTLAVTDHHARPRKSSRRLLSDVHWQIDSSVVVSAETDDNTLSRVYFSQFSFFFFIIITIIILRFRNMAIGMAWKKKRPVR